MVNGMLGVVSPMTPLLFSVVNVIIIAVVEFCVYIIVVGKQLANSSDHLLLSV